MTCTRIAGGIVCTTPTFRPGDQAPSGYLAWHEWAEIQHKAGLRQKECGRCGKWKFPQQLSRQVDKREARSRKGPVLVESPVCLECVTLNAKVTGSPALSASPCGLPGYATEVKK